MLGNFGYGQRNSRGEWLAKWCHVEGLAILNTFFKTCIFFLSSFNYNTGELIWERPFGTLEELAPWPVSMMEGPPNLGGAALTASGLTFIASTTDFYFRAFATETGKELWKVKLPTGGHASPMTYRAKDNQKQYVLIAAAGHFSMDEPTGDYLIAYALPN